MKKVLAVMLVFALTNLASAAVVGLSAPEEATTEPGVLPGTEVVIQITSDAKLLSLNALVSVDGPGELIRATSVEEGVANFGWDASFSQEPAVDAASALFVAGNFNGLPAADIVAELVFVTGDADATISIANDTSAGGTFPLAGDVSFADPITIKVVPEPMTLSLLGLGGLALIRRRR